MRTQKTKSAELAKDLGGYVRNFRKKQDLTQADLAKQLHTTQQYVSGLECGKRNVTLHTLVALACLMEVKVCQLLEKPRPHFNLEKWPEKRQ